MKGMVFGCLGSLYIISGVYGGANGVLRKSKVPLRCVCADIFGHVLECQSKFKVNFI